MARRSTTADQDVERLQEEFPKGLSVPLERTATLFEEATRIGLGATLWPMHALPRSLRGRVAQSLRAGVAISALLPHAMIRAVNEAADRLQENSGED